MEGDLVSKRFLQVFKLIVISAFLEGHRLTVIKAVEGPICLYGGLLVKAYVLLRLAIGVSCPGLASCSRQGGPEFVIIPMFNDRGLGI